MKTLCQGGKLHTVTKSWEKYVKDISFSYMKKIKTTEKKL